MAFVTRGHQGSKVTVGVAARAHARKARIPGKDSGGESCLGRCGDVHGAAQPPETLEKPKPPNVLLGKVGISCGASQSHLERR